MTNSLCLWAAFLKRLFPISLLLACILTACGPVAAPAAGAPDSQNLIVFAAASLTDAFTEIGGNFEAQNPGVAVTFNFGGSQMLRTQIEEGAPVDVFASANAEEMALLIRSGFVVEASSRIFLTNELVLILPANNPAGIDSLEDLSASGVKLVLAAEEVPVGKYSRQALEKMTASFGVDFKDKVLANVVSNEDNVRQVVAKVQLGEADAGIVYISDAVAVPELRIIEIPADLNAAAAYPIAPLTGSANIALAEKFVDYVLSNEGQAALRKWGFGPVP